MAEAGDQRRLRVILMTGVGLIDCLMEKKCGVEAVGGQKGICWDPARCGQNQMAFVCL